jgi:hypothetical protein
MNVAADEGASGTDLNSILSALAAMPPPPPEKTADIALVVPKKVTNVFAESAEMIAAPPAPPSSSDVVAEETKAHIEASKFYNNAFSDPSWHNSHEKSVFVNPGPVETRQSIHPDKFSSNGTTKERASKFYENSHPIIHESHSKVVHNAEILKDSPRTKNLLEVFRQRDVTTQDMSKFYNNKYPVVNSSHNSLVHSVEAVDRAAPLGPASGVATGTRRDHEGEVTPLSPGSPPRPHRAAVEYMNGVKEEQRVAATTTAQSQPDTQVPTTTLNLEQPTETANNEAVASSSVVPLPAGMSSEGVAQAGKPINNIPSPIETREYYMDRSSIDKTPREGLLGRPRKSSRYLRDFRDADSNPLRYSKDYDPNNVAHEPPIHIPKRRSKASIFEETDPSIEIKVNSRVSRQIKRLEAARNTDDAAYAPKLANAYNHLRHSLNEKDASHSGFVNFDEFRSALIKADVHLNFEQYLHVFHKYTDANKESQVDVPIRSVSSRSASTSRQSSPRHMTRDDTGVEEEKSTSITEDAGAATEKTNKLLREQNKGIVGTLSQGRVLHIDDFIANIREGKTAKHITPEQIAQNMTKEKRRVFCKVLHSMNKASDPSQMFRHLDNEQLGHLKPKLLRDALVRLGAPLSDSEFSTLLNGIGHNDDSKSSSDHKIDLDSFDKKLHEELAGNEESWDKHMSSHDGTIGPGSHDGNEAFGQTFRRLKKPPSIPGQGQAVQNYAVEDDEGLTHKITNGKAAVAAAANEPVYLANFIQNKEGAENDATESGRGRQGYAAAATHRNNTTAAHFEKMSKVMECLRPHRTEFTRMVESKHTKDASMKWSKLKWALQKQPHGVLNAFVKTNAKFNERMNTNGSKQKDIDAYVPTGSSTSLDSAAIDINDVESIPFSELDKRMRNSGVVLGQEDKAILAFHMSEKGKTNSNEISIQDFCNEVGIPLVQHQNNQTKHEVIELDPRTNVDGGIFNLSTHHGHITSADRKFGTSFYDEGIEDQVTHGLMHGMRKKRVPTPHGSTIHQNEPWKYLAELAHGSDAIWPAVPKSADTHKPGSSFHFSKRLNVVDCDYEHTMNIPLPKRAGRSSSAPPRTYGKKPAPSKGDRPYWSNSDQFVAAQSTFAQQEALAAAAFAAGKQSKHNGPDTAEKLQRWAAQPLVDQYVSKEEQRSQRRHPQHAGSVLDATALSHNASSAVNNEGTVSSRAHVLTQYKDTIDSARVMNHTLRRRANNNPNIRPTRPFALDGDL